MYINKAIHVAHALHSARYESPNPLFIFNPFHSFQIGRVYWCEYWLNTLMENPTSLSYLYSMINWNWNKVKCL